jgi:hypothetical protein
MRFFRALTAALLVASPAFAQPADVNPFLEKAQKILEELKYAEAAKMLEAAWASPGNDHATTLEILKLQGVVAATLGNSDKARQYFRGLLYLAPDFVLPEGDLGPKVISTFYEAKGRVTEANVLRVEALPPERDDSMVHSIAVGVKTDPLKLAKTIRFHTRIGSGPWTQNEVALAEGKATQPIGGASVQWWAEAVGDKDRALALVGSAPSPIVTTRTEGAPVATNLEPADPTDTAVPQVVVSTRPNLRPVAYGVAGAGALSLIIGIIVGAKASALKGEIDGAKRESDGSISGITRARAVELNGQMQGTATAANALMVSGLVLAGTGVAIYFLSGPVKVAPTSDGVVVGGNLP